MKAKIIYFVFSFFLFLLTTTPVHAADAPTPGVSATFANILEMQRSDNRVLILKAYLEQHNSPLAPYADVFITQADKYNLPWQLVPAIAGTESTFAQAEPLGCYNSFGFGIYTNHMTCFPSYADAIKTVTKALRENYVNKWNAHDVYAIGRIYAASEAWPEHTLYFINDIERFRVRFEAQTLFISL